MKNKIISKNKYNNAVPELLALPEKNEKINDQNILEKEKKEVMAEIKYLKEMIQRTILSHNNYKILDILTSNDLNMSIQYLEKIYQSLENLESNINCKSLLEIIEEIKLIEGELSSIFRNYGTQNVEDLIQVTFGNDYLTSVSMNATTTTSQEEWDHDKFAVLKMHFHPTAISCTSVCDKIKNCRIK